MLIIAFDQKKKCQATSLRSGLAFFCFGYDVLAYIKNNKFICCYTSIVGAIDKLKPGMVTHQLNVIVHKGATMELAM